MVSTSFQDHLAAAKEVSPHLKWTPK